LDTVISHVTLVTSVTLVTCQEERRAGLIDPGESEADAAVGQPVGSKAAAAPARRYTPVRSGLLIDKFGRTWEGRYGGVDRAVIGAHTLGYNSNAFAMSVLGTYTSKEPEADVIAGYKRLIAWKFQHTR
jgi:hypothetical protein